MDDQMLLTAALGLPDPWHIARSEMKHNEQTGRMEMHIYLSWKEGALFPCPEEGCDQMACPCVEVLDEQIWRYHDLLQYRCFIHASLPRISCPSHGIRVVRAPWDISDSPLMNYTDVMLN
ncbi:MAG: hypothetical protein K9M84_08235 [Spirochaetia bacterium]|nr:hypothetical protein [Spirochaetia bacterium]